MERKKKKRVLIVVALLALLLSVPAWFAFRVGILPRIDHAESFHAPVFSPDGQDIYCLSRKAWGVSWGPGIEFFTPPASVTNGAGLGPETQRGVPSSASYAMTSPPVVLV